MTLLAVVNCPRSQEDMVSNWQPTHSLLDDELSVAEIAAAPLFSGFCCKTPASLPLALGGGGGGGGRSLNSSWLALLCYLLQSFVL